MDPNSINDYLSSKKQDFSAQGKAALYEKQGLGKAADYLAKGADNANENTALLNSLRAGESNITSTSGPARMQFSKDSMALDNALKMFNVGTSQPQDPNKPVDPNVVNDPYMASLDAMAARSDASINMLIKTIQGAKQRSANKVNADYENYKGGLQLLGIQHNEAQSSPDLLMGHIKEAENQHQAKLQELDSEEAKALLEADMARKDNDFKIVKEKMDYVNQLKKDKIEELKNYHSTISDQSKTAGIEAHDIYDTLNTLADSEKEQFIQAVAKKFNLPLGSLVTALADEKSKRESADLKTQNTESIIAKRGTTGSSGGTKKKLTQDQAAQKVADQLNSRKGTDNYISPEDYIKAREVWVDEGGFTQASFDSRFKSKVNPKSYGKVGFTAKSGRSS